MECYENLKKGGYIRAIGMRSGRHGGWGEKGLAGCFPCISFHMHLDSRWCANADNFYFGASETPFLSDLGEGYICNLYRLAYNLPGDPFCGRRESSIKPPLKVNFDKRTKPEGLKAHE